MSPKTSTIHSASSLVRIYSKQGEVVGGGYLAAPGHIISCAHVIAAALGCDKESISKPVDPLSFDLPQLENKKHTAYVANWFKVITDANRLYQLEDIAVLRIAPDVMLPPEARHAASVTLPEAHFASREVRIFGYPGRWDEGDWVTGKLTGGIGPNRAQLNPELGRRATEEGFSGAPVLDVASNQVLGILVADDKRDGDKFAYMIHTEALVRAWPELAAHCGAVPPSVAAHRQRGEYQQKESLIIKTMDHGAQINAVNPMASDRAFYWYEACDHDWPESLADHLFVELFGTDPGTEEPARHVMVPRNASYWEALLDSFSIPCRAQHDHQQDDVWRMINSRRCTVLYTFFNLQDDFNRIPLVVTEAQQALSALPEFAPGCQLLVLFICLRPGEAPFKPRRASPWLSWLPFKKRSLDIPAPCGRLPKLRKLNSADTSVWLKNNKQELRQRYDTEFLRYTLGQLFDNKGSDLRYAVVRDHLTIEGGLRPRA